MLASETSRCRAISTYVRTVVACSKLFIVCLRPRAISVCVHFDTPAIKQILSATLSCAGALSATNKILQVYTGGAEQLTWCLFVLVGAGGG